MILPEPKSLAFSSLFDDIERGQLKIPQFQRDFVWDLKKSRDLMDSIIKGYPIGTFIFWKTKERLRYVREIGNVPLKDPQKGDFVNFVLDGQQRLTTIFACLKGIKIKRENKFDYYSEMYIDLNANKDEQIIIIDTDGRDKESLIKIVDLIEGDFDLLGGYLKRYHPRLKKYRKQIENYLFSIILVKEVSIDVATEIFTRINIGGKPLSLFEIMVAKTFDKEADFDLSEKYNKLIEKLVDINYETIPDSTVLQTVSVLLTKACTKKQILKLDKEKFINIWDKAEDAIIRAIEYFRLTYRIPVSRLLPYNALVIPFAYFFYHHKEKPLGVKKKYLEDFFWRCAIAERYTAGLEGKLAQDIRKIDDILNDKLPKYEWLIDISPKYLKKLGYFSTGKSFIKAILALYAYHQPKSFNDNSIVNIANNWLKRANSKNYHHFFPKAYLKKLGKDMSYINHILNITIVDDFLNKRVIKANPPSKYMVDFKNKNPNLDDTMKTHLINDLNKFGVWNDDYDKFIEERAYAVSKELNKRMIKQKIKEENSSAYIHQRENWKKEYELNGKKIYVFGHGKDPKYEFPNEKSIIYYLREDLFLNRQCRYRRGGILRSPDIIIFSWNGKAYGTLYVDYIEPANAEDRVEYPNAKKVFVINSTEVFQSPVVLKNIGIENIRNAPRVSNEEFFKILEKAGKKEKYPKI